MGGPGASESAEGPFDLQTAALAALAAERGVAFAAALAVADADGVPLEDEALEAVALRLGRIAVGALRATAGDSGVRVANPKAQLEAEAALRSLSSSRRWASTVSSSSSTRSESERILLTRRSRSPAEATSNAPSARLLRLDGLLAGAEGAAERLTEEGVLEQGLGEVAERLFAAGADAASVVFHLLLLGSGFDPGEASRSCPEPRRPRAQAPAASSDLRRPSSPPAILPTETVREALRCADRFLIAFRPSYG